MKIYTFFTDSHKLMLKYFMNSFKFNENADLIIRYMPQQCEAGDFMTAGWNDTMKRKVQYVLDSLDVTPDGEVFVHSDCDVLFIKDCYEQILSEMGDSDIIFQSDWGQLCMGFFACKSSDSTRKFFTDVFDNLHRYKHDQEAAQFILKANNESTYQLKTKLFSNQFFNYGMNGHHYRGEESIVVPDDICMFHANFCETRDNKIKLLEKVKSKFNV